MKGTRTAYTIRPIQPEDGRALADLLQLNPDTGRLAIAPRYQINPYTVLISDDDSAGFVAEMNNYLCGIGLVELKSCFIDGKKRPCALLNTLVIHPDHRRQGIARALAQKRIEYARSHQADTLLLAGIQSGNNGSFAVVKDWRAETAGPVKQCLVKIRQDEPVITGGVDIRTATVEEYEAFAAGHNQFYSDHNLYRPLSAAQLAEAVEQSPLTVSIHHTFVAVRQDGLLLAGLHVKAQHRLIQMQVLRMPAPIRLLNRLVKMVPPDGILRQAAVSEFWFAQDQEVVAQQLWEWVRWRMGHLHSTHLTFAYDPRGLFTNVLQLPRWLPQGEIYIALSESLDEPDKLLYPI